MKTHSNKFKKFKSYSLAAKIILIAFFLFFLFEMVLHVFPLLFAVNNSLKTSEEIYNDVMAPTRTWSFINYANMLRVFKVRGGIYFEEMLWNSVWQTGSFLIVNIGASTLVAYVLARYRFPGRGLLFGFLIFKQTIPIIGTGAAGYKLYSALGLINNPYLFWISLGDGFDYSAFILYGTFKSISNTYSESAKIDGAGNFKIMFDIILPIAFPAIIALLVTNFTTAWNNYAMSQINLNKFPSLAYGLFIFQHDALYIEEGETVFYAALVVSALPGVIIYCSLQNLVVKNLAVGGIKG